jgi:hypothetical protein
MIDHYYKRVIPTGAGRLFLPRSFPVNASACVMEESLRVFRLD